MSGLLLESNTLVLKAYPSRHPQNTPSRAMQTHHGAAQELPGSHSIPAMGLLRSCSTGWAPTQLLACRCGRAQPDSSPTGGPGLPSWSGR